MAPLCSRQSAPYSPDRALEEGAGATSERQIVWLTSGATAFRAPCDACRGELGHDADRWSVGLHAIAVEGTLCAGADVGFMTCRRGHRIVVRRAVSRPLELVHA